MDELYRQRSLAYWNAAHDRHGCSRKEIRTDDWLEDFDGIISETARPILDLGCGGGNDTLYLLSRGKQVCACDQSPSAIRRLRENFPEILDARCLNMLDGLPYEDEAFEVIIADLCLHYFTQEDTGRILAELRRILTPGGHLIFRVNSVRDVLHGAGQGKLVEPHLYETKDGTLKRFFDEADIRYFFRHFRIGYLREETMTRYETEKRLFRVCAQKSPDTGRLSCQPVSISEREGEEEK